MLFQTEAETPEPDLLSQLSMPTQQAAAKPSTPPPAPKPAPAKAPAAKPESEPTYFS